MPEGKSGQETNTAHNIPAGNTLHNPTGESAPRAFDKTHLSEAHAQGLLTTPESPKDLKKSRKGLFAGLGGGAVALVTTGAVLLSGGGKSNNNHVAGPTPNRTTTSAPANPSSSVEVTSPAPVTSASSSPETSTTPEQSGKLVNTMLTSTPKSELAHAFGKVLSEGLQAGDKHFINSLFDPNKPLNSADNELTGYDQLADQIKIQMEQDGTNDGASYVSAECSWAHYNAGGVTGPAVVELTRPGGTKVVGGVLKCTISLGSGDTDYYRLAVFADSGKNASGQDVWIRQGDGPLIDPQEVDPHNINPGLLLSVS